MADQPEMPKPRGRPAAPEPGSALTAWVPQSLHDKLIVQAAKSGESVSGLVRILLTQRLKK